MYLFYKFTLFLLFLFLFFCVSLDRIYVHLMPLLSISKILGNVVLSLGKVLLNSICMILGSILEGVCLFLILIIGVFLPMSICLPVVITFRTWMPHFQDNKYSTIYTNTHIPH